MRILLLSGGLQKDGTVTRMYDVTDCANDDSHAQWEVLSKEKLHVSKATSCSMSSNGKY